MARRVGGVGSVGPERREHPRVPPAPTKRIGWRGAFSSTGRKLVRLMLLAVLNCSLCEFSFGGDLTVRTTNPAPNRGDSLQGLPGLLDRRGRANRQPGAPKPAARYWLQSKHDRPERIRKTGTAGQLAKSFALQ